MDSRPPRPAIIPLTRAPRTALPAERWGDGCRRRLPADAYRLPDTVAPVSPVDGDFRRAAVISVAGGCNDPSVFVVCDPRELPLNEAAVRAVFAQFGLVAQSSGLLRVFRDALKVSEHDSLPVLILGETGTGKQRLAEAIHQLHPRRREKRLVTVNCAAIGETLAESTLFGHRRGAFTGAEYERLGAFRVADGGTLLLDEISDLHPAIQPKLLHVLQERRLTPVGEDFERPVDVRIIAATNRPLEQMVREDRFRADLYERLCGWPIRIPPLRERPDDVELQAQYFLAALPGGLPAVADGFSREVLDVFRGLPWPGNTRQLENLVRATLAHGPTGPRIELADLPPWLLEPLSQAGSGQGLFQTDEIGEAASGLHPDAQDELELLFRQIHDQHLPLKEALQQYERQLIESCLRRHGGSRNKTAAALGISERGLFGKLKRYRLF